MGEGGSAWTVVLRPSRGKLLAQVLLGLVFAVVGVWMGRSGKSAGWFVAGVFGIGSLGLSVQLFPNASYLALSAEGFVMCSMFRPWKFAWTDVGAFAVGHLGNRKVVMFNFSDSYRKLAAGRAVARIISGAEGALPDTYGMGAEELARLLNEWRLRR